MSYSFYFPTKIVVSEQSSVDILKELETIPNGNVFMITDEGLLKIGIPDDIHNAIKSTGRHVGVFSDVPGNPDVFALNKALEHAQQITPKVIIALGGGSVIDVAKAVSIMLLHSQCSWEDIQWGRIKITQGSLPVIAIPTTAGTGSEVTHVTVIGDSKGFKKGVVHPAVFSRVAILDGTLTVPLPPHLTAATGMDALVHGIEAYLGKRANPITDLFALASIRDIIEWLPEATHNGKNLNARQKMIQAASWAGIAMDQAGLSLCHALCGPVTAHYHLHHGLGNAVLLPATLAFNAPAIPAHRWENLRKALNLPEGASPESLSEWSRKFIAELGLPTRLAELGVKSESIRIMAEEALKMAMIGNNIRPVTLEDCIQVLEEAL